MTRREARPKHPANAHHLKPPASPTHLCTVSQHPPFTSQPLSKSMPQNWRRGARIVSLTPTPKYTHFWHLTPPLRYRSAGACHLSTAFKMSHSHVSSLFNTKQCTVSHPLQTHNKAILPSRRTLQFSVDLLPVSWSKRPLLHSNVAREEKFGSR